MTHFNKEEINAVYEGSLRDLKSSNQRFAGLVGGATGSLTGVVAASFIAASTGGTAFLALGVGAVGAALGVELVSKFTNKSIKEEKEMLSKMTEEEAHAFKLKSIEDIRGNFDEIRKKANEDSLSNSVAKITIIGS